MSGQLFHESTQLIFFDCMLNFYYFECVYLCLNGKFNGHIKTSVVYEYEK